jgi:predicted NUDIX family phosphoesterase
MNEFQGIRKNRKQMFPNFRDEREKIWREKEREEGRGRRRRRQALEYVMYEGGRKP